MNNSTSQELFFPGPVPLTILKCICILLTVVGNGVVILAVITNKRLRRVPDNLFICSLAVTDFLMGALVMAPETISTKTKYKCQPHDIWFQWSALMHIRVVLGLTSVWNLFIISYDRYHFIVHRLQYSTWMSGYKVPLFCIAGWLISILLQLLNFLPAHYISPVKWVKHPEIMIYYAFLFCIGIVTPVVGMLVAYAKILYFTNSAIRRSSQLPKRGNMKQILVLSALVCTFYILLCPHIIYLFLWALTKRKRCAFLEISSWLVFCNSLVNPLIYTIFNASFRQCILNILTCRSLRRKISFRRELTSVGVSNSRSPSRTFIDILERTDAKVVKVDQNDEHSDYEVELSGHRMISGSTSDKTSKLSSKHS